MSYDMIADWKACQDLWVCKNVSCAFSADLSSISLDFTLRNPKECNDFTYTVRAKRVSNSNKYEGSYQCHYDDETGNTRFSLIDLEDETKLLWGTLWKEQGSNYRWWVELTPND